MILSSSYIIPLKMAADHCSFALYVNEHLNKFQRYLIKRKLYLLKDFNQHFNQKNWVSEATPNRIYHVKKRSKPTVRATYKKEPVKASQLRCWEEFDSICQPCDRLLICPGCIMPLPKWQLGLAPAPLCTLRGKTVKIIKG